MTVICTNIRSYVELYDYIRANIGITVLVSHSKQGLCQSVKVEEGSLNYCSPFCHQSAEMRFQLTALSIHLK